MQNLRKKLSILLICQLVLAAGLWALAHQRRAGTGQNEPLLSFDTSQIDRVVVERGDDQIELVKSGKDWTIPEFHELPADTGKLVKLLTELSELKSAELVATSASSQERLGVSQDKSTAQVHLYAGDSEVAHLRVGQSPSFGKQYVRVGDEKEVHSVRWSPGAVQATGVAWFDKAVSSAGKIKELQLPDFTLKLENGTWSSGQEKLDQAKVKDLVSLLEDLKVFDVAEEDMAPDFQLRAVSEDGKELVYRFSSKGDEHYVRRDDGKLGFKLSKATAEKLREAKLETLLAVEAEEPSTSK